MIENYKASKPVLKDLHAQLCAAGKLQKWIILNHGEADSGEILAREERVVCRENEKAILPVLEVWIPAHQCFVLGKHYMKRVEKQGLVDMDKVRKEGIPIVLRSSGGEAILHDGTCLNFGVIVPRWFFGGVVDIGKAFSLLSSGVLCYLQQVQIAAYFGKTKTFCPGPYDILAQGRKIAGISLLLRKNFCLVHGTLLVNSGKDYFSKLKLFYPLLEEETTSLHILTGKKFKLYDVAHEIIQSYKKTFG